MNLTELVVRYVKHSERLINRYRPHRPRPSTQDIAYYENAAASVEALTAQGPLPTGQIWHLEGREREISGTAWGTKAAKTAAK